MSPILQQLGIDLMSEDQRLELAQEIIGTVIANRSAMPLSEAQIQEIHRRVAEDDARPDEAIPAELVHEKILAKLRS